MFPFTGIRTLQSGRNMPVGYDRVDFEYCLMGFIVGESEYYLSTITDMVRAIDPQGSADTCGLSMLIMGFSSEEHRITFLLTYG